MDVYSSKRPVGGITAPKKKSVTALKDTAGTQNESAQICSRIGCCGRPNNSKGTKNKSLEKPKPLRHSIRSSSSGKEVIASSSKNCSSVTNLKKPIEKSEKKVSRKIETILTESTIVSNESQIQEVKPSRNQTQLKLKSRSLISDQNNESNNVRKKRFTQGESSSSGGNKGKKIIGVSTNKARVSDPKNSRNLTSCKTNGSSSFRARKSSNQEHGDDFSLVKVKPTNVIPEKPKTQELIINGGSSSNSTNDTSSTISSGSSSDRSIVRFANDNGPQNYNIDGIVDVLLALDRTERDEELTYEQLLSLEANLFLGGFNLYDQHRDMRLDIDNMSYEELLVLEEKMGTVSTALSEEEISKCIKTSIYESSQLEDGRMRSTLGADDSKCSICQEEFVRGDKIGKLGCMHGYHTPCINHWLQLKNWCPICKASPKP